MDLQKHKKIDWASKPHGLQTSTDPRKIFKKSFSRPPPFKKFSAYAPDKLVGVFQKLVCSLS